jgi:tetratricopeptide (TPR) repeat protein
VDKPTGIDLDLTDDEPVEELPDGELEAELPALPARGPALDLGNSAQSAQVSADDAVAARRRNLFPSVDALDFSAPEPPEPAFDDVDLPSKAQVSDELDLDVERRSLPTFEQPATVRPANKAAPKAAALDAQEIDLPSIPPPQDQAPELDLPSPVAHLPAMATPHRRAAPEHPTTRMPKVTMGAELPAVVTRSAAAPSAFDELPDLMADLPVVSGELPSLAAGLPSLGGADLPDLTGDLPIVGGNLPMPAAGLPSPAASLPSPSAGLPNVAFGLPDMAAGLPDQAAGLPGDFSAFPTSPSRSPSGAKALGAASIPPAEAEYGNFDFGGAADFSDQGGAVTGLAADALGDDEGEFDAFPTEQTGRASSPPRPRDTRGGGTGYGEVALDGGAGGGIALEEEPQRPVADSGPRVVPPPTPGVAATVPAGAGAVLPQERKRVSRGVKVGVAAAVALTVAGGALALLPDVGPYGSFIIIDTLKAGEYDALLQTVSRDSEALCAADSVQGADRAFAKAEASLAAAPRFKPLRAYAAYSGFARQVRFGRDTNGFARAQVLLDSLEGVESDRVPYLRLARAARDIAEGKLPSAAEAQSLLGAGSKLEGAVLVGESALASKNAQLAMSAWSQAGAAQASPRTAFGLARAQVLAGKTDEAQKLAESVLAKNAKHPGAQLLLARLRIGERARDQELVKALEGVLEPSSGASQAERVEALNLLGRLHMIRSRVSRAEESFNKALAMQANSIEAMLGLGDAFFASGRNAEALARYEAATKVDATNLTAQLGIVRAKLALESLEDATKLLDGLSAQYPKSTAVAYWFGRAKELVGERELALESYRTAADLAEDVPELVSAYAGLTRLLGQLGQAEEAAREAQKAVEKFPDRPEIYVAMGDLATSQANYDRAVEQYDKALALDPQDIGIHFKRGVAFRRARNFESAQKEFELVAKGDPEFPGLALEWGLLYEASGRAEEALVAYESALKKAPKDPDLMLRVGCGKANAGQAEAAEKLLRTVLEERSNSAETNHCLGRAILLGGGPTRLREAMRYLERAVILDANRAEHHLYVGWAANELNDPLRASQALTRALELDQTLADAYWQRGVLRGRQGAVRDAVVDLERALQLSPSRFEAHAGLADAYFNLGREQDALAEWNRAVSQGPAQPVWYFRYGKLLFDNRRVPEARAELQKAVAEGQKLTAKPLWLWEAHRLLALCIGRHPDAVVHWQTFVVNADSNSPYRAEAMRALKALGQ